MNVGEKGFVDQRLIVSPARTLDDLADFMAGKILSALGFSHHLYPKWGS